MSEQQVSETQNPCIAGASEDPRLSQLMEASGCDRETCVAWLIFFDTFKPTQAEMRRLLSEVTP